MADQPLSLADFLRLSKDPLQMGVIMTWQMESMLMDILPWRGIGTLHTELVRALKAPVPTWRKLNATFTRDQTTVEPVQERVYDIGGKVDADYQLVHATNQITPVRAFQTQGYAKAIAYAFNDVAVNGDPTVNEDALVGLKYRVMTLLPATQHINLNGLDVSPDASGLTANFNTYLDALDRLIHRVDGHMASVLLFNDTLFLRTTSGLRQLGLLAQDKDQFGRWIYSYKGARLIDLGFTTPDGTTKVIPDTENNDGGLYSSAGGATSVYAVRVGGEYLNGIFQYPMRVQDLGLTDEGIHYRTIIEWPVGLLHANPRSFARLSGVVAL